MHLIQDCADREVAVTPTPGFSALRTLNSCQFFGRRCFPNALPMTCSNMPLDDGNPNERRYSTCSFISSETLNHSLSFIRNDANMRRRPNIATAWLTWARIFYHMKKG
jgi:hypothetical protein